MLGVKVKEEPELNSERSFFPLKDINDNKHENDSTGIQEYEFENLKKHLGNIKIDNDIGYTCECCGMNFDLISLRKHLGIKREVVTLGEKIKIPSEEIKDEYEQSGLKSTGLNSHVSKHTEEATYECEYQKNKFKAFYRNLKPHERIHTGERPYRCEQCGKKFIRSSHLKIHLTTHTGTKPFKCQHCEKRFNNKPNLKQHLKRMHSEGTHTGETTHECEHCGKKFKLASDLKTHLVRHTGDRPYQCEKCGKRYLRSSHLTAHLKIHTGAKPFKCQHCDKRFIYKREFKQHLMRKHSEDTYTGERLHMNVNIAERNSIQVAL